MIKKKLCKIEHSNTLEYTYMESNIGDFNQIFSDDTVIFMGV